MRQTIQTMGQFKKKKKIEILTRLVKHVNPYHADFIAVHQVDSLN